MRWLLFAASFVVAVWLSVSREEQLFEIEEFPSSRDEPIADLSIDKVRVSPMVQDKGAPPELPRTTVPESRFVLDRDRSGVINFGEPMDPTDLSTWLVEANSQVINIGEPMDPNDPSTWPGGENDQVINFGEPMDPNDPTTWPGSENTQVINIGEPIDPNDPTTWPGSENTQVINIGEPMDPGDPFTWPRDGR